jgi:hypothetical protein
LLILASVFLLGIAFSFSNNMTLMLTPDRWLRIYAQDAHGLNLNLGEPQLVPRYLHFLLASVAVVSLTIGCFGWYWHRREPQYARWLLKAGARLYLVVTLSQIPIGLWFMMALPPGIRMNYLGGESLGTAVFMGAMVLDLVGLVAMGLTALRGGLNAFRIGLFSALGVIFLMVIIRHLLRDYYVQGFFHPESRPVDPQWIMLGAFILTVLLLLGYAVWLLKVLWRGFHAPSSDAPFPLEAR